jgi:hypothetical protein
VFACNYKGEFGHLLISESYVCFLSTLLHDVKLNFSEVASIKTKKASLMSLHSSSIEVSMVDNNSKVCRLLENVH